MKTLNLSRSLSIGLIVLLAITCLQDRVLCSNAVGAHVSPLLEKGRASLALSRYGEARSELQKALQNARTSGDKEGMAEALFWLARLSLETGRYNEAVAHAGDSLRLFGESGSREGCLKARLCLINAILSKEERARARQEMGRIDGIPGSEYSEETRADFFLTRGRLLALRKEYELAGKNYEEALKIARESKDRERVILACYYMARLYTDWNNPGRAEELCWTGLEEARRGKSPWLKALLLEADGEVRMSRLRYREASISFDAALALYRASGNSGAAGYLLLKITGNYQKLNESEGGEEEYYEMALSSLDDATAIFRASDNCPGLMRACLLRRDALSITRDMAPKKKLQDEVRRLIGICEIPEDKAQACMLLARIQNEWVRDYKRALESAQSAEEVYKGCGNNKGVIRSLLLQGDILRGRLMEYSSACELYDKALRLSGNLGEIRKDDDPEFFSDCSPGAIWRRKGQLFRDMGRYEQSIAGYEEALNADMGNDHLYERITDLTAIVRGKIEAYDFRKAEASLDRALKEVAKLDDPVLRATAYSGLVTEMEIRVNPGGGWLLSMSRNARGIGHAMTFFSQWEEYPSMSFLKKVYQDKELVKTILQDYQQFIRIEHEKKQVFNEGMAYIVQSFVYLSAGMVDESRDSLDTGFSLMERNDEGGFSGIMKFLVAFQLLRVGRQKEAVAYIERALESISRKGDPGMELTCLCFLGMLKREMGQLDEGMKYLRRADEKSRNYPDLRFRREILLQIGFTFYCMKNYGEALDCFSKAEKLYREAGVQYSHDIPLFYMAQCYYALGSRDKALECYRELLRLEREKNANPVDFRDVVLGMGSILQETGREEEALGLYLEAAAGIAGMRSRLFSSDDRKRFSEQKANRELFERATQLLIRFGRYDEALKNIEASQSVEMFNSLNLEGVKTQDKEYAGLLDRLRELSRKMTLLDRDISGAEADEIQRREYLSRLLAGTRQEFFSVINEIKSRNPDFEQLISVRPLDLVAVQKAIPQDTILLEYYPSREKLYIFSISADTFSIKSVDVAQERLYSLVTDFRSSILGKNNSGSSKELAIKGSVLYSLLLAPVENELQGHAHIQIIPGGLLWYLPFEALRNGDRGYFLNEKTVGYLSSSDILGLIKGKENGTQNSGTLIAFGDPEGVSLPASREEVESLGKIWPESRIFSGRNATKEQFLKEAGQASYIHIASHSSLDRSNINSTCITFAGTDSRLTLGEIYGLALAKSPLVVLSSCDSALGEDNPGRELASLSSAFQTAGASSVIASLWKVEDTSTRVMFGEFYEALKKGESRADALRSAKMALLRRPATSHPFYWAGFILYGDWRR